ncbi:hypothetical protein L9F63_012252, partial [Diploptera punctata]
LLVTWLATTVAQEGKWVWQGRNSGERNFPDYNARPIYRPGQGNYRPPAPVFENADITGAPPPFLQPSPSRPPPRPPVRPGQGGGSGILTGPVPSWEQRPGDKHSYKDYEHCKCDYGFNCKSPGIKFGHCDDDKQYCCFNSKSRPYSGGATPDNKPPPQGGFRPPQEGFRPPQEGFRPPQEGFRPPQEGFRPPQEGFRPPDSDRRPILVGPGGPTGIVTQGSRPFKPPFREEEDRPPYQGYGTINDDNFPRPPYDPFGRNANLEAKKNGKKL